MWNYYSEFQEFPDARQRNKKDEDDLIFKQLKRTSILNEYFLGEKKKSWASHMWKRTYY